MISRVGFQTSEYHVPPHKFEAGTPNIAGAVGLHAALDYLDALGRKAIHAHDTDLAAYAKERLAEFDGIRIFGPTEDRGGLVSFVFENVHALDLATMADQQGVAIRIGHHCTQPLHRHLDVLGSARASLYIYNTKQDVDAFIAALKEVLQFFAEPI